MSLADQASLLLIPSGYKSQKVYSIFPTDGVGDFDFSRSSSATRIAKNGLITTVAANVPRLEYPLIDGVVNGCPSLLLEPQSTNLIPYSEDFSVSDWTAFDVTKDANSITDPAGNLTGCRVTALSGSNRVLQEFISLAADPTNDRVFTGSFYIKSPNTTSCDIRVGAATSNTPITISSEWQRFDAQYTLDATFTAIRLGVVLGAGGDIIDIAFGQVEEQSYATSYIPTDGSAVTRSAETANGSGDANTFNDSEGVLMVEISALVDDGVNKFISISDGTINNRVNIAFDTSNNISARQEPSSVNISTSGVNILNSNKIAYEYQSGSQELWVNGFKIGETSVSTLPSGLDRLNFDSFNGGDDMYCNTKQVQYYNSALTDSELEQLTSWTSFTDMANGQLYTIE